MMAAIKTAMATPTAANATACRAASSHRAESVGAAKDRGCRPSSVVLAVIVVSTDTVVGQVPSMEPTGPGIDGGVPRRGLEGFEGGHGVPTRADPSGLGGGPGTGSRRFDTRRARICTAWRGWKRGLVRGRLDTSSLDPGGTRRTVFRAAGRDIAGPAGPASVVKLESRPNYPSEGYGDGDRTVCAPGALVRVARSTRRAISTGAAGTEGHSL